MLPEQSPVYIDLSALIRNLTKLPVTRGVFSESYLGDMAVPNGSRKVALKMSRVLTSGRYNAMNDFKQLNNELLLIKPLFHPNVARFLGGTYNIGQRPAIVMTWYPHGDAPTFLEGRSIDERHHVIKGLLKGLCYLHDRSPAIAHGDIRGANILINDSFEGVISDFSLSRFIEDSTGSQMCTAKADGCIRWMARELIHDEPPIGPNHASDVWSFGCTFYELILGKVPYSRRKRRASIIRDIIEGTLPFSEEDAIRGGSGEMWAAVCRCWNLNSGDRPSILELKNDLSPLYD